jgi:protein arginine kinase
VNPRFDPVDFAARMGTWLESPGPEADVVVSCRARLARNVAGYPFASRMSAKQATELAGRVREALDSRPLDGQETVWLDLARVGDLERLLLRERHLASRELAPVEEQRPVPPGRAVAFARGETAVVMVGEEDHLRLGGIAAGLDLGLAFQRVRDLDLLLEEQLDFAADERLGYLTACPTNVGTGLRASVMLHLPALGLVRSELEKVFTAAQRTGLAVRGQYGEGSRAAGDLYQVSNQVTLGRSEGELVEDLRGLIPCIVDFERKVRHALLDERRRELDDRVTHALGVLRTGQQMATDVALAHVSTVRMGVAMGLVDEFDLGELNALSVQIQKGHVQALAHDAPTDSLLDAATRDRLRAEFLERFFARRGP